MPPCFLQIVSVSKMLSEGHLLAQSVDHSALDLRNVSLSPTLGIEITFLKNEITCFLSLNIPLSLPRHHLALLF